MWSAGAASSSKDVPASPVRSESVYATKAPRNSIWLYVWLTREYQPVRPLLPVLGLWIS
jgi:hypothetical protein